MTYYTYQNLAKDAHGRLGNQLWQIAWMIGQAKADPAHLYVDPNWAYRDFFCLPEEAYEEKDGPVVDGGSNFFQELSHWDGVSQSVWEWFQPSELAYDYLYRNYPKWLFDKNLATCSIHHRRGDYLNNPHMFPQPTDLYYETAIGRVQDEEPYTQFVVFSDDYGWITQKYVGEPYHCIRGKEQAVDPSRRDRNPSDQWDLFLMSQFCTRHIIANSSFSWWGAFLSLDIRAFYPSVWWGPQLRGLDATGRPVRETWREGIPDTWQEISV